MPIIGEHALTVNGILKPLQNLRLLFVEPKVVRAGEELEVVGFGDWVGHRE